MIIFRYNILINIKDLHLLEYLEKKGLKNEYLGYGERFWHHTCLQALYGFSHK